MGQAQDRTGGASRFHRLVVARRDTTDVTVASRGTLVKSWDTQSGSRLVARSGCGTVDVVFHLHLEERQKIVS